MKNKPKEISVAGIQYVWAIKHNVDGEGGNRLTIWKDKKIIFEDVLRGNIDITPKRVINVIETNEIPQE